MQVEDWRELEEGAASMARAAFLESRGADYYTIGTASDIQVVTGLHANTFGFTPLPP